MQESDKSKLEPVPSKQEGGDHYQNMTIQPVEYCLANNMGFAEGSVIKYVSRYRHKGEHQDLKKAIHFLQMILEDTYAVRSEIRYSDK